MDEDVTVMAASVLCSHFDQIITPVRELVQHLTYVLPWAPTLYVVTRVTSTSWKPQLGTVKGT